MRVIATAGHVDHGKSTLVRSLTGVDPDRLPEEKARSLTIDLGFAFGALASGEEYAIVDVPGHVRFLKNMLAGVGSVEACLFVVALTEGWKPQSEEHLRIVDLLGVPCGIVVLTKASLVEDAERARVQQQVTEKLNGTFLETAEIVAIDALSGQGIDELQDALGRLFTAIPDRADLERPRLWIDRSFPIRGAGTVVTGTLTGGALHVGMELCVEPVGRGRELAVRVRGLQSRNRFEQVVDPGWRVAVNLNGASHRNLTRGQALVRRGDWALSDMIDGSLRALSSLTHPIGRSGAYLAYFGTGEHAVRLRVLQASTIEPGEQGLVRIFLPRPLPLVMGDRFIVRDTGRSETVGGGEVLDVLPVLAAARARPDRSVDRIIAEHGWIEPKVLQQLCGTQRPPNVGERWIADARALESSGRTLRQLIERAGWDGVDLATLDDRQRALLTTFADVAIDGGRARAASSTASPARREFVSALDASPFTPPNPHEVGVTSTELSEMIRTGEVVKSHSLYFAPAAVERAGRVVAAMLARNPHGVTTSAIREELRTTRKFIIPLLELLDREGVTRRRGDVRIGGPRLPETI